MFILINWVANYFPAPEKKMILKNRGRDKLKTQFYVDPLSLKYIYRGHFWSNFVIFGVEKKWTVRDFFGRFLSLLDRFWRHWDLSKNRPHKKHCDWARTPPWEIIEIYRFLTNFHDFGAFNRAGKTVSKIGIYSKPPPKSEIYGNFNISRPNFVP
jgi:hypothetical protein